MAQLGTFAATATNVVVNNATRTVTISNEVVAIDGTLDPPTGYSDWGGWTIVCTSSGGFRSVGGATGTLGGGKQSLKIIEETGGYRFGGDNFQANTARFSGDGTNVLKYHNIVWIVQAGGRSDFDIYRGTNSNGSQGCRIEFSGVYIHQQAVANTETNFNHYSGRAAIKVHPEVGFGLRLRNETNGHAIEFSTPVHSGVEISGLAIDNVTGLTDGSGGSVNRNPTGARVAVRLESAASNSTTTLSRLNTPSITDVNGSSDKTLLLVDPVGLPTLTNDWGRHVPVEIRRSVPFTFTGAAVPAGTTMHAVAQTSGGVDATATMSGAAGSIRVRTNYAISSSTTLTAQNTYRFFMTALGLRKYSLTTTQTIANSPATITAALTADTLPSGAAISTITAPATECDTLGEILRVVKNWEVSNPTLSTAPTGSLAYVDGTSVKFDDGYSVVLNAAATELVGVASGVVTIKCANTTELAASNGLDTLEVTGSGKTITTPSVVGENISPAAVTGGLTQFSATDFAKFTTGTGYLLANTGGYTGLTANTTYYARDFGGLSLISWHASAADAIAGLNLLSISGSGTPADMVWQLPGTDPVEEADAVFLLDSTGQKSVISVTNNLGADARFTLVDTSDGATTAFNASVSNGASGNIVVNTKGLTTGYRLVGKRQGYQYFSADVNLTGGGSRAITAPVQAELLQPDGLGSYVGFLVVNGVTVADASSGTTPGLRIGIHNSTLTARFCFKAMEDFLAGAAGAKFLGLGGQQPTYVRDTIKGDQFYCGAHCKFKRQASTDVNAKVRASLFANDDQPIDAANGDIQTVEGLNIPALATRLLVEQDFDSEEAGTQSIWGKLTAIETAVDEIETGGGGGGGGATAQQVWEYTGTRSLTTAPPTAQQVWEYSGTRGLTTAPPTASATATAVWGASTRELTSSAAPTASAIADAVWSEIVDGGIAGDLTVTPSAQAGDGLRIPADDASLIANGDAFTVSNDGGYSGINTTTTYYAFVNSTNDLFFYATREAALTPGASWVAVGSGGTATDVRLVFPATRPIGTAGVALQRIRGDLAATHTTVDAINTTATAINTEVTSPDHGLQEHAQATAAIGISMNQLLGTDFVEGSISLQKALQIMLAIQAGRLSVNSNGTRFVFHRMDSSSTAVIRSDASDTGRTDPTVDPV